MSRVFIVEGGSIIALQDWLQCTNCQNNIFIIHWSMIFDRKKTFSMEYHMGMNKATLQIHFSTSYLWKTVRSNLLAIYMAWLTHVHDLSGADRGGFLWVLKNPSFGYYIHYNIRAYLRTLQVCWAVQFTRSFIDNRAWSVGCFTHCAFFLVLATTIILASYIAS